MNIDFESFYRNRIESMLISASWVQAVQSILGLKGISQVWGERAEWYLWLHRAPGAYSLSFQEADALESDGRPLYEGRFALKCYPYPDHPVFPGFSPRERSLVTSQCFDPTNTPRFEAVTQIPNSLFTIGSVSFLLDPEETLSLLTFDSLDAFKILQSHRVPAAPAGAEYSYAQNLIRNVPGWEIGFHVFDCLVGLYAHFLKRAPAFIGATRSQGFEYTISPDQAIECHPSKHSVQKTLSLGFEQAGESSDRIEALWRSRLEPDEEVLVARNLPLANGLSICCHSPENTMLNPIWWELANADLKSELSSLCGCADHH